MNCLKVFVIAVICFVFLYSCQKKKDLKDVDFRAEMIQFVKGISVYAKSVNPDFIIIPQNGEALFADNSYVAVIDGIGKEDLNYGYDNDGVETSSGVKSEIMSFLDIAVSNGKFVLVTDYVFEDSEDNPHFDGGTVSKINNSYVSCRNKSYIPYCTVRNLNYLTVNPGYEPVEDSIHLLNDVKEFLYYLQPPESISRQTYISSIANSDFDMVIMDMTVDGTVDFTKEEILQIKNGLNQGKGGYVIAYMSIGEAEDYRFYWNKDWAGSGGRIKNNAPDWLYKENPDWKGNYKVLYWKSEWKDIIYGNSNAYLDKIMALGFDGVYMDIIDGFEYFEDIMGY
ncbi:MAG: endo alpha-1,4 polygalactosaminidase [Bacteroidota bacterium]